jgi:multisubunit Na+/H+ antiporter MnhE subunit
MTIAVSRSSAKLYIHAMYGEDPDAVVHDIERMLKQPLLKVMPPKGDKHSTVMRGEV